GTNIGGATDSSYTITPVETNNSGTYSVAITNSAGFTNSAGATLTVLGTNFYVDTVLSDFPLSYWRLDEGSGTLAQDGVGNNLGQYTNATLAQPGFSLIDTDAAVGLPASSSSRGFVLVTNFAPFNFNAASTFTLEAWAYFTNFTTKSRLFSTLNLSAPGGFAFGVLPGGTGLEFTAGGVRDTDVTLNNALVAGLWYHLACVCDGNSYNFYVNGQQVGQPVAISGGASPGVAVPLVMGCNPPAYNFAGGDNGAEQINGRIDEAAIYTAPLGPDRVLAHYNARYGTLTPPAVSTPIANPPTNYVSLSATLQAVAAGQLLTYQWYKAPSTLIPSATSDTYTISPLQLSDGGNYFVQVTNQAGSTNSPGVTLTVLPIPTTATDLNLTNGLVLHLPFDGDYGDISGHSNNGTNVGATVFTNAIIGTNALHYSSDSGSSSYNYVTLGVRPDLQFGASTDFTVSYWVRQPSGSMYTNLPFFTDAIGSTGNGGFAFAPYETATSAGGWSLSIGSMSTPSQFTSFPDANLINDGNWHHLVHVANRNASVATYLDGTQV
ncbi:MAG TPA: LamG-like jellyroll fold domain-containing protein, partial [Tepidisphaeraceae bacterium]|nr:LamG-like jellyroll fold domain-containing protein [Tepidisphaeraceae bacterium]